VYCAPPDHPIRVAASSPIPQAVDPPVGLAVVRNVMHLPDWVAGGLCNGPPSGILSSVSHLSIYSCPSFSFGRGTGNIRVVDITMDGASA
jgi:hypothetical protein